MYLVTMTLVGLSDKDFDTMDLRIVGFVHLPQMDLLAVDLIGLYDLHQATLKVVSMFDVDMVNMVLVVLFNMDLTVISLVGLLDVNLNPVGHINSAAESYFHIHLVSIDLLRLSKIDLVVEDPAPSWALVTSCDLYSLCCLYLYKLGSGEASNKITGTPREF